MSRLDDRMALLATNTGKRPHACLLSAGSCNGLGHTNVGGATMYPSVSACNNGPATTEADDEAGVNYLY